MAVGYLFSRSYCNFYIIWVVWCG